MAGLRVAANEEIEGLDIGEHGKEAYHLGKSTTLTHLIESAPHVGATAVKTVTAYN